MNTIFEVTNPIYTVYEDDLKDYSVIESEYYDQLTPHHSCHKHLPYQPQKDQEKISSSFNNQDFSIISEDQNDNSNKPSIKAYEANALGRQVAYPIINGATNTVLIKLHSNGQYRVIYSHYLTNPNDPIFNNNSSASLYSNKTQPGRMMQKIYLPKKYRNDSLSQNDIIELRQSGARMQSIAGYGLTASQVARLGINVIGIALTDDELSSQEEAVVILDTSSVASNIGDSVLYNQGLINISKGNEIAANRFLIHSHRLNLASNVIQIAGGAMRVYTELSKKEENINNSTVFFGSLDVAGGAAGITYSTYLLRSAKTAKVATSIANQNNTLMGITKFSPLMQGSLRFLGVVGATIGFGMNAYAFGNAWMDESLSPEERTSIMISSSLGMTASAFIIVSTVFVTVLTGGVAAIFLIAATGLLVTQSIYDFWPEIQSCYTE